MQFVKTTLKEELTVKRIVTVHYFEFAKDYIFEGEVHDFWELLYVDKGEIKVMADTQVYRLRQGEIIFHKPNEFHNVWANGKVAPNVVIIAFECKSPSVKFFENRILTIGDNEKDLLAQIIRESMEAFSSPLNIASLTKMEKNNCSLFGCEQLIKTDIEQLLISLVRKGSGIRWKNHLSSVVKEHSNQDIAHKIITYLGENLSQHLNFDSICRFSSLGRTSLKKIFKEVTGMGVIEYYRHLKIEAAKTYIRDEQFNCTEIAEKLGYTSVQYFSRHFKNATGMAPLEYASSVKVKI